MTLVSPTWGQNQPNLDNGFKPYGSFEGGSIDTVNVMNGNVILHIPLLPLPGQRGGALSPRLFMVGNSKTWGVSIINNAPNGDHEQWVPSGGEPAIAFTPGIVLHRIDVTTSSTAGTTETDNGYFLTTPDGNGVPTISGSAVDTSGWKYVLNGTPDTHGVYPSALVTDRNGVQYQLNNFGGLCTHSTNNNLPGSVTTITCTQSASVGTITDPNGNVLTIQKDTLGRSIFSGSTSSTSNCPTGSSASYWNLLGPNGTTSTIVECAATLNLVTNFNQSGILEAASSDQALVIVKLTLPDTSSWSFTYDTYGNVTSIATPWGGSITYQWATVALPVCSGGAGQPSAPVSRTVTSRTLSDGTNSFSWHYAWGTPQSDGSLTNTVTDPLSNDTVHVFSPVASDQCALYETSTLYYQGSASSGQLLKRADTSYIGTEITSDGMGTVAEGVVPASIKTTLSNGEVSLVQKTYDGSSSASTFGDVLTEKDYDYGSGSQGALLREMDRNYEWQANSAYKNANLLDLLSSVVTKDGSGNRVAETDYGYDDPNRLSSYSGTTVQHVAAPNSVRGNLTSVSHWLNTSTSPVVTYTNWYDTGEPNQTIDPNGNTTTYAYSPTFYGAYVTQTTLPPTNNGSVVQHIIGGNYDFNTGLLTQFTDQNGQVSNYAYDFMWRMTSASFPDGGGDTFQYPNATTVERLKKIVGTTTHNTFAYFDGLGRVKQTDDASAGNVLVNTTYDAYSRVATVTNPFIQTSDQTYGVTTYTYDALGRTTQVTHPDNAKISTSYAGRATEVTDEGNGTRNIQRISQADALGRLTSVCEVTSATQSGSSGTPAACGQDIAATGFLTTYQYDAPGNLLQVNQGSLGARTFAYDSLSRLTSATNPESGTTAYTYDADSNMISRTQPEPNQTNPSVTVTTTYQYDALNRMTEQDYTDNTIGVDFNYDETSPWGTTLTNTIGRRTTEYAGNTGSDFSYDAMGRVASNHQCTPQNCGTNDFQMNYTYDLAGDLASSTDGQFNLFTDIYNAAGQLTSLTSSYSDSNHPATLFSSAVYNAPGQLTSAHLGNGITETRAYNNRLWMTSLAAGAIYTLSMTSYAPNGNVLGVNDTANGNWTYTYDDFNRLLGSSCSSHCPDGQNTQGFGYGYDRFGNRWKQTLTAGSGGTSSLSFSGSNNRIDGYSYDAAGNLLNDKVHNYTYDAEHRIVCVDNGAAVYLYDSEGRRVRKMTGASGCSSTTGTAIVDYLYDLSGHAITEVSGTGVWNRGEIYAGGRHIATYDNLSTPTTYFDHADWLGTERVRSTVSGTSCETIASLPFGDGEATSGSCGDPSTRHFTGKERDPESNLDYFGARYNSSNLGRFMSADRFSNKQLTNPQDLNLYIYTINNPLRLVDPDGRDWKDVVLGIGQGLSNFVVHTAVGLQTAVEHPSTIIAGTAQALGTAGHAYFTSAGRSQLAGQFSSLSTKEKTAVVTEALTQGVVGAALTKGVGAATKALSETTTTTASVSTTAAGDTFTHYGYLADADSFAGGLRPGSFATAESGLTGAEAQSGLALPGATVPDAAYPVTPEPGTPVVGPTPVQPANGQPGGLPEVQFPDGTGPGTVGTPKRIPPK